MLNVSAMALQRTLSIIKPDAVEKRKVGAIIERLEGEGFRICGLKQIRMTLEQARGFYLVHRSRPFYEDLTHFMSRGPIIVMVRTRR